jgi:acyl homoserine lactone synthase
MLRYLYADQLHAEPKLAEGMFKDRARQFKDRLQWEVSVDQNGYEKDQYDALNPLYVVWQLPDGSHGGSMRFLPTMGPTMVNDHFSHLADGRLIRDPDIWECTRFCLSPEADSDVAAALMLGGAEVGKNFALSHAIGVFGRAMTRVYGQLGWGPVILGSQDGISAGLWEFSEQMRRRLCVKAGILPHTSSWWFNLSFNQVTAARRLRPARELDLLLAGAIHPGLAAAE